MVRADSPRTLAMRLRFLRFLPRLLLGLLPANIMFTTTTIILFPGLGVRAWARCSVLEARRSRLLLLRVLLLRADALLGQRGRWADAPKRERGKWPWIGLRLATRDISTT